MFKWRKYIGDEIDNIHDQTRLIRNDLNLIGELVQCEICGCLLRKSIAIKGKSIIRTYKKVEQNMWYFSGGRVEREVEEIYTPYYCKLHKEGS